MENKQPTYGNGKICYIEIPAITAEASADFYSDIFGWKVRERGDGALAFDDTGGGGCDLDRCGDDAPDGAEAAACEERQDGRGDEQFTHTIPIYLAADTR